MNQTKFQANLDPNYYQYSNNYSINQVQIDTEDRLTKEVFNRIIFEPFLENMDILIAYGVDPKLSVDKLFTYRDVYVEKQKEEEEAFIKGKKILKPQDLVEREEMKAEAKADRVDGMHKKR